MEQNFTERWLKRAWKETMLFWSGPRNLILSFFALPIVGFVLHYIVDGSEAVMEEFQLYLIYALAAASVIFIAVLFYYLIMTPFRQRDEAREEIVRLNLPPPLYEKLQTLGDKITNFQNSYLLNQPHPNDTFSLIPKSW